jgi:acyl-CoA synthetase (AMP-forming)/AMP-acid ligase II
VTETYTAPGVPEPATMPAALARAVALHGDVDAIADYATTPDQPGVVHVTFAELAEQAEVVTRALMAAGIETGDTVAIWAHNIREWVVAAVGIHGAGGVVVPLNTRYKGFEAYDILSRSHAKLLFGVEEFVGNRYVDMLRAEAGDRPLPPIVLLRGAAVDGATSWDDFLATASAVTPDAARERAASVKPTDLSDILFTSGTTGRSKGVMVTHEQTTRVFTTWANTVGLRSGDRMLLVNPFFHSFGYKAGIVACILMGATIVAEPAFDVDRVLARIASEHITAFPGPPTVYLSILNHPHRGDHDLSSLRLAVTGAAAVPVEMIDRMRKELTFETIVTAYGLSESTGTVTICRPDDDAETISHTSGRAIDGVEVQIVDPDGNEVPRGDPGEIICRGYNVMVGYLDDPKATAEAIDADGWLHTGDIGTMDERGYVQITDRTKDMFIIGGNNAYPAEIENFLLGHPGIAQAAVIGVPDERMGEVGAAFVIPRAGATLDPAEIIAWSREKMANFKVPRHVYVVDSLPTNPAGKVLKFELRAQAAAPSPPT